MKAKTSESGKVVAKNTLIEVPDDMVSNAAKKVLGLDDAAEKAVAEETSSLQAIPGITPDGNIVKRVTDAPGDFEVVCDAGNIRRDIIGIFTTPRLVFADNMMCAQNVMTNLGMTVNWSQGVFWGQVMSRLLEDALKKGFKYAMVVDYDSLFCVDDVRELYAIMEASPDASAVVPLQLRRGDGSPLCTILDVDGNEALIVNRAVLDVTKVQISTGHFGLTLLRLKDLKKMQLPWFESHPNVDGKWENGKIDEDIMFWKRMRDAGNKLYLAPNVHIGHMELVGVWADNRLNPVYQPINEFQVGGKPSWAFGKRMTQIHSTPEESLKGVGPDFNERV